MMSTTICACAYAYAYTYVRTCDLMSVRNNGRAERTNERKPGAAIQVQLPSKLAGIAPTRGRRPVLGVLTRGLASRLPELRSLDKTRTGAIWNGVGVQGHRYRWVRDRRWHAKAGCCELLSSVSRIERTDRPARTSSEE